VGTVSDDPTAEPQRPTHDDSDGWRAYWQAQGMPWRTEPELDEARQRYLAERRAVRPDVTTGIYPFRDEKGSIPLTRADVEWLLATHESGGMRGPVEWEDPAQRKRVGVDLRGACLEAVLLDGLPLARLQGALTGDGYDRATPAQRDAAALQLRGASLRYAQLEGAALTRARLDGVNVHGARLERADLYRAHFEATPPADLTLAVLDAGTRLDGVALGNERGTGPRLEGVQWNGARLGGIDWAAVRTLDDEHAFHATALWNPTQVYSHQADAYPFAVQAYRQLAVALRDQGLNEHADRYAYRAQVLQRVVLRRQHHYLRYVGSLLLDLLAGYGYRPGRAILLYLAVIVWFANCYVWASHGMLTFGLPPSHVSPLAWYEALILSVSSFHGRGFQPFQHLNDPVAALAGIQAVFGLVIEVSFIATFTQRFFAR
jgi:hypothetical protein